MTMAAVTTGFRFHAHQSIYEDVKSNWQNDVIAGHTSMFSSDFKTVFQDPDLKWTDPSYMVVVLPGDWLKNPFQVPAEVQSRITQGTVRFIFWNVSENPSACSVPATHIPTQLSANVKSLLLAHICRPPGWGVQTLLPPKSKILTERINSEKQIARKIEQSLTFICKNNPAFVNQGLPLRLAMTGCFSAALAVSVASKLPKPPVFQIGQSAETVVFSLRWKTSALSFESWKTPNFLWQAIFHESLAGAVQLSFESQEVEVLLVFSTQTEATQRPWLLNHPLLVDVLTTDRLRLASQLPAVTDSFAFDYFEIEDKSEAPTEFVSANPEPKVVPATPVIQEKTPASKENLQMELTGLRVEYQKLEKQIKIFQEQANESTRKMSQAVEAEKMTQIQVKTLTSQLEKLKTAGANQNSQELGALKTRLENAKQKEQELVKKLTQALDQIKQLKTGQQKAS